MKFHEGDRVFYNGVQCLKGTIEAVRHNMVEVKWDDGEVAVVHPQYLEREFNMIDYAKSHFRGLI